MPPCKTCGESIWWLKTTAGKMMPVDTLKTLGGNIEIIGRIAQVLPKDPERFAHRPHWATCKNPPARKKDRAKATEDERASERTDGTTTGTPAALPSVRVAQPEQGNLFQKGTDERGHRRGLF